MISAVTLAVGLFVVSGPAGADQDPSKDGRKRAPNPARMLLEEGRTAGSLPAGVIVRVQADLATSVPSDPKLRAAAEARGVDFSKRLDELWEFTADRVYRVVMEVPPHKPGENLESVYRRVESRPFDSKALCRELLDGKSLEIAEEEGQGEPLQFVGTHYNIGGRSIQVLRNGESVLHLGEHCTSAGYAETDARAFAALYEKLASQARLLFKAKAAE
ncbi:MAG TPA: hypothetical protein VGO11_19950 [Chthoniobacteraceae bacterium]|nr:hypothetical protein [Chthoniobacteraceae bacterium]